MIDTSKIPTDSGCYQFKDFADVIIYIGKAKNLRKRVKSYFSKKDHDQKTQTLVQNIHSVDFIVTDNEVEALILERNLVKKHQPKYNIDLKDSKSYAYLLVPDEPFPRLLLARDRRLKGSYFGPFVSGLERDHVRYVLVKAFKLRTCKTMPKRPCLRYHIGLCTAPCDGSIDRRRYDSRIETVKTVLKGGTDEIVLMLEEDMKKSSMDQEFEKALELRDQISALKKLGERQKMERLKRYDEDIINYIVKDNIVHLLLFHVFKGTLAGKQEFTFEYSDGFLSEFIVRYYSEYQIPKEIIVPSKLDDAIVGFLTREKGSNVLMNVPKIGEKKKLLDLVLKNIEMTFFVDLSRLEALQKSLRLNDSPNIIECFDISHLSGSSMVGSMVRFSYGKPDKNNYRRYKIKTVDGVNDTAAIAEVVRRRYTRLIAEEQEMPNLIVIDGGKGQLHAALSVLKELEVRIPTISLAKRLEEVFVPGLSRPLLLDRKDHGLHLLQQIRDEAHRFAISYNRILRRDIIIQD
ncbi:excinuclease ABC subunit C [Candidatus Woesearchaeota archaeon CG11_big_fil_rev_8_21_14_0_20_43_8]|nr:MAG: excinuclease ABC subunit C [Candidatus Woesearchaeota archaeon CG11_big_fil_rev_8_21_14_0_20_43_8]PIO04616.1 MAG: excinuclease ABC subunit C [Candidatus Woesearchaeota archaeon CG08_land_8_20_14_0_20_43_7]